MDYQNVFERYEYKYFITPAQKRKLLEETGTLEPDQYGRTVIRNIYYDTDSCRLIRDSLDHPVYKETGEPAAMTRSLSRSKRSLKMWSIKDAWQ